MLPILMILLQAPEPDGDQFAASIAAGHDVNGDGVPDLAIADATPCERIDIWLMSGRDGSTLRRHPVRASMGTARVDLIGDVDGDGHPEMAVGVRTRFAGWLELVSTADGRTLHEASKEDLGFTPQGDVRAAGDVDGDGATDLLAFAAQQTGHGAVIDPSVVVLSGRMGSLLWRITGDPPIGVPLRSFTAVGDVDGDGRGDFAVCHEGLRSCRKVVVYSGRTGDALHAIDGPFREFDFGISMDGGHDYDHDGRPDLMIGSPSLGTPIENPGRVRIYSIRDGALLASIGRRGVNRRDGGGIDAFGEQVRFLRDIDDDGVLEILVGSPEEGIFEGAAYVRSGMTGAVLHRVEGRACSGSGCEEDDYHTGRAVASAGDLDRDGVEDFVVANVPYDRGQRGRVRAISGQSGTLLFDLDRRRLLDAEAASRR